MIRLLGLAAALLLASPLGAETPLPVHIGGRVAPDAQGGWRFGWPGTYFESRFRGTAVTARVESPTEHLRLSIDGEPRSLLTRPGVATITIGGLAPGEHFVRLDKLTESQTGGGRFLGFFAAEGSEPLSPPSRPRQIEFIGDSYTVGYGNVARGRTCTRREVHDLTDTSQAFGPILAGRLDADYRVNAFSGFGIVRNYAGGVPESSLPILYPRLVPGDPEPLDPATAGDWHPQLIVINLGTNDFSTPLHAGERWRDAAALHADYRARYVAFARMLMGRQPQARLLLMGSPDFFADVEQVAAELNRSAARPVFTLRFADLELTGCDWHPSLADHRALADLLEARIRTIDDLWP